MDKMWLDTRCFCRCQQAVDVIFVQKGFIPELPCQSEPSVFIPAKIVETAKLPSFELTFKVPSDPGSDAIDILDGGCGIRYKRRPDPETFRI